MNPCFLPSTLYSRGWGSKEGSLRRWPVVQTDQELPKLPGSNAPEKHVEVTKKGNYDWVNQKHGPTKQKLEQTLETLDLSKILIAKLF